MMRRDLLLLAFQRNVESAYLAYDRDCWSGIKFAARALREETQYEVGMENLNAQLLLTPAINNRTADYKSYQYLFNNLIQMFQWPVMFNAVNVVSAAFTIGG
jgi:hypothetical protein